MTQLKSWLPDPFTLSMIATVVLASFVPVQGAVVVPFDWLVNLAIAALFFMHGAKLARAAVVSALTHWRLNVLVLGFTFVLFPLLGLALKPLAQLFLTPELLLGFLFLCALPSTVQSSVVFTSMARGNVSVAVVCAALSSMLGVFVTPLLFGLLLAQTQAGLSLHGIVAIVLQLLLPFVAGHVLRPWLGAWVERHRKFLSLTDRGTVLLVVYSAFSASVAGGLWHHTPIKALVAVGVFSGVLLAIVMAVVALVARLLRFERSERIAVFFCGSKKSMASGIPMAKILFAGHAGGLGALVLPLMIFHPLQLMVCGWLAQRWARQRGVSTGVEHR